ncbi:unnamed protein product [Rotaria magnacalcarata]|uniref:NAD(P)(+)--arginine ADP-ribosyltransferase n=1 Tax=Rotaria magnacalcarata TaxID=392030 RepID=A0A815ATI0_9BILA|nr:unnamed protein product [Rotaria magnacalcarata]CAF1577982.1 unnamed protein product [Rotaria magnacalcarata]CAF2109490.1 unnamed protein product [Rotaria magnacalcarata]CAF3820971.1 unnamed protein product [Rotaria magnacalcarata]CAF3886590.1 unnamed protein product [Rotaria magnacalcarata]
MVESFHRSRFFDFMRETGDKLSPMKDYQQLAQPSLEEAIACVQQHKTFKIDADIQNKVSLAKKERSNEDGANDLTTDESAAIQLYTMESKTEQESLFYILNSTLRLADRNELKPFLLYVKLLLGALEKIPSFNGIVYRGIPGNISSNFVKGKKITWWGFSSCTRSLEVLSKEEFLGTIGQRTIFYIECTSGKSIQHYSYLSPDDEEILLLPGIELLVTNKKRTKHGLSIVYLQEITAHSHTLDYEEMLDSNKIEPPREVDFRKKAKQKRCGHNCNLWSTKNCCNCSGLCLQRQELSSESLCLSTV